MAEKQENVISKSIPPIGEITPYGAAGETGSRRSRKSSNNSCNNCRSLHHFPTSSDHTVRGTNTNKRLGSALLCLHHHRHSRDQATTTASTITNCSWRFSRQSQSQPKRQFLTQRLDKKTPFYYCPLSDGFTSCTRVAMSPWIHFSVTPVGKLSTTKPKNPGTHSHFNGPIDAVHLRQQGRLLHAGRCTDITPL